VTGSKPQRGRWARGSRQISEQSPAAPQQPAAATDPATELYYGRLARTLHRERACRADSIPEEFLGEPAWDVLLDLFASEHERREISVSSACIAANAPATTGLRYIARLEAAGWVERVPAPGDRRRSHLRLTQGGRAAMQAALSQTAAHRSVSAAPMRSPKPCCSCRHPFLFMEQLR
jgi:hypothetical protein